MPEEYTVNITPQAQEQLREIIKYINRSLQASRAAQKMLDTIEKEIDSLKLFPNRVPLTEEEPWHSQGVHKLSVKNYLVYYWIDEKIKQIHVIGVIYGRRNQRDVLSNLETCYSDVQKNL